MINLLFFILVKNSKIFDFASLQNIFQYLTKKIKKMTDILSELCIFAFRKKEINFLEYENIIQLA